MYSLVKTESKAQIAVVVPSLKAQFITYNPLRRAAVWHAIQATAPFAYVALSLPLSACASVFLMLISVLCLHPPSHSLRHAQERTPPPPPLYLYPCTSPSRNLSAPINRIARLVHKFDESPCPLNLPLHVVHRTAYIRTTGGAGNGDRGGV